MARQLPRSWGSLSELLFALRREEFLAGPFETELFHPETGAPCGKAKMPPFLYRGEPAIYPSTLGGLWRAQSVLTADDFQYVQQLLLRAATDLSQKSREPLPLGEAVAFAQHYGFLTPLLDWSSSLYVSAHFAVGPNRSSSSSDPAGDGCYMRLNLRRAQEHLALLRPTMLGGKFQRPSLQKAWSVEPPAAVGDREGERREDEYWRNIKSAFFVDSGIVEVFHWRRNQELDRLFYNPYLDCPPEDPFVGWPVLLVNGFVEQVGPMSDRVATLLLDRLPLYHLVCFDAEESGDPADGDVRVPSQLFCAGVHPGRIWDREVLRKLWTETGARDCAQPRADIA